MFCVALLVKQHPLSLSSDQSIYFYLYYFWKTLWQHGVSLGCCVVSNTVVVWVSALCVFVCVCVEIACFSRDTRLHSTIPPTFQRHVVRLCCASKMPILYDHTSVFVPCVRLASHRGLYQPCVLCCLG